MKLDSRDFLKRRDAEPWKQKRRLPSFKPSLKMPRLSFSQLTLKHGINFCLILLIVLAGVYFIFPLGSSSVDVEPEAITGAAIVDVESQGSAVHTPESYHEFTGECVRLVKQAVDDVDDVESYISGDRETYETLKQELEDKIKTLRNEYEVDIRNAEVRVEKGQRDLDRVRENLEEVQNTCN